MATDLTVAKTILEQLGGSRFRAMTGAKYFVGGERDLAFHIGRNAKGISHVTVALDPNDTYTMTFQRVRNMKSTIVASHSNVYCDQLQ